MRLAPQSRLFLGLKIDSKLREALAHATPGDKRYFEDATSQFLRVLSNGDEQWIGKVIDGGIPPGDIDDVQRNVLSILNRIAPGSRHSASSLRIFTVDDTPGIAPSVVTSRHAERDAERDRDRDR
jgi:hypothetical protein